MTAFDLGGMIEDLSCNMQGCQVTAINLELPKEKCYLNNTVFFHFILTDFYPQVVILLNEALTVPCAVTFSDDPPAPSLPAASSESGDLFGEFMSTPVTTATSVSNPLVQPTTQSVQMFYYVIFIMPNHL